MRNFLLAEENHRRRKMDRKSLISVETVVEVAHTAVDRRVLRV